MAPQEIQQWLKRMPFVPFRVFVADGQTYDVPDPRDTLITHVFFIIGLDPDERGLCQVSASVQPAQITRIEPIS